MKENIHVKFTKPLMTKCGFVTNEDFVPNLDEELHMKMNLIHKQGNFVNGYCPVYLCVQIGERSESQPFFAEVEMGTVFQFDGSVDDKMKNSLIHLGAPALLYGYIRPVIATITNYSAFPSYDLPLGDFSDSEDKDKKDEI